MKRFLVALVTLAFILGVSYCQSAEEKKPTEESKAKMEQKGEKKSSLKEYEEEKTMTSTIIDEYEEDYEEEEF